MEKPSMFFLTAFINRPPTKQPAHTNFVNKHNKHFCVVFAAQSLNRSRWSFRQWHVCWNYLEPWCKNPKQSQTLEENMKYLPALVAPVRSKRTIFSTNLDAANNTPAPCSRKRGEKRTGRGIFLAPAGLPWNSKPVIYLLIKHIPKNFLSHPTNSYNSNATLAKNVHKKCTQMRCHLIIGERVVSHLHSPSNHEVNISSHAPLFVHIFSECFITL